jgi:iron complex transport system ATP-binding protein
MTASVVSVHDLTVVRDGRTILALDALTIGVGERWVVLGANGSGKTTFLTICAGRLLPTTGMVDLLGQRVGRVDLRQLRARIGLVSSALTRQLRMDLSALEVVIGGLDGSLEPWWRTTTVSEVDAARGMLERVGVGALAEHRLGALSDGERQQVLLARALFADPPLLLADEPSAGLDLGARERLLNRFDALAHDHPDRAMLLVTHHVEEIPRSMTHALVLRSGRPLAAGPIAEVVTSATITACFDLPLAVTIADGRFGAHALP